MSPVAVARVDFVVENVLNTLSRLVPEEPPESLVGPLGHAEDPPGHQGQGLGIAGLEMLALDRPPAPREVLGLSPAENAPKSTNREAIAAAPRAIFELLPRGSFELIVTRSPPYGPNA